MECNYSIHICIAFFCSEKELWSDIFRCKRILCVCVCVFMYLFLWVTVALSWQACIQICVCFVCNQTQCFGGKVLFCPSNQEPASCLCHSAAFLFWGWPCAEHLSAEGSGLTLLNRQRGSCWLIPAVKLSEDSSASRIPIFSNSLSQIIHAEKANTPAVSNAKIRNREYLLSSTHYPCEQGKILLLGCIQIQYSCIIIISVQLKHATRQEEHEAVCMVFSVVYLRRGASAGGFLWKAPGCENGPPSLAWEAV